MSDFLSNFSGANYDKTRQEKLYDKEKKKKSKVSNPTPVFEDENVVANEQLQKPSKVKTTRKSKTALEAGDVPYGPVNVISDEDFAKKNRRKRRGSSSDSKNQILENNTIDTEQPRNEKIREKEDTIEIEATEETSGSSSVQKNTMHAEEFIETDPTYQKKKRRKIIIISGITALALMLLFVIYYQMTHVAVPDFKGKELAEARTWTAENDLKLKIEQKYDFKIATNVIIKQSVTKNKIKKGKELVVTASLGPDPEEVIPLPEFKEMKSKEAKNWIEENKTDNLAVIEEYSDTIAAGGFVKFEMTTKDVKPETYKRKDKGKIYFSKGKEVYEKDIPVPDFTGKAKEEATEWTRKNEIELKIEEEDSNTVESGKIISQSVAKDQKMAKKESLTVKVSTGKALTVPNFSNYTLEEASSKTEGLQVQVQQLFNDNVPYGRFIGQSIEAGTKYNEKSEKPSIQVTYSAGRPFLKDLRDTTLEGDLQKIFYDEYQSKGANITYQVSYLDSSVTKGTVIQMSKYNEFVPVDYIVQIGISKGNLQPAEAEKASE